MDEDIIGADNGYAQAISNGRRSPGQSILDRELDARFARMELQFVKGQRVPWHLIWSAAGVLMVVLAGMYALVIAPLNVMSAKSDTRFDRVETAIAAVNLQTAQLAAVQASSVRQFDQLVALTEARHREEGVTKDEINRVIGEINDRMPRRK